MKKKLAILLLVLLAWAWVLPLPAAENLPPPFKSSFKIFRGKTLLAKTSFNLISLGNDQFVYRSEVNLSGWVTIFYKFHLSQESRWRVKDQQIQALEYSYKRVKKKKENHKKIIFDWENNQAYATKDGKEQIFPLETGMTDELLFQINTMYDLKMNRRQLSYTFLNGSKIKTYHLENLGEQLTTIPMGKFSTVKLRYQGKEKHNITTWFAKELHYMPIKIVNTDKHGAVTTAVLDKVEWTTLSN